MNRPTRILVGVLSALVAILSVQLWLSIQEARRIAQTPVSDEQVLRRVRWLAQEDRREWANSFLGVPLLQYPTDLMTYQRLLYDVKPDIVIETGTAFGGLTLYLAVLLENINEDARVLSVDIQKRDREAGLGAVRIPQRLMDRIQFFDGSSTDPKIVEQMAAQARGKKVIVILDSLHVREHVLRELELYSALVPRGGYIIVNDTHLSGTNWVMPGHAGPDQAAREFLQTHQDFEVAPARPDFIISCFPAGILTRVR
jgi:cephalosporin hydroxylase